MEPSGGDCRIGNPEKAWKSGALDQKNAVIQTCFAAPLRYSGISDFQIPKLTIAFHVLEVGKGGAKCLVDLWGARSNTLLEEVLALETLLKAGAAPEKGVSQTGAKRNGRQTR